MNHVTRFLPYRHSFVCNNLLSRELKYHVELLEDYFKGTKEGFCIPNFSESKKYLFLKEILFVIPKSSDELS